MIRAAVIACVLAVSTTAHAGGDDPFNGGTVAAQAGAGVVGGALFGTGGAIIGGGIGYAIDKRSQAVPVIGALIGVSIGISVGVVAGVDYAGEERGANGSRLGASLGVLAGDLAFIGFEVIVNRTESKFSFPVHLAVGLTTLLGGSIIGYHLTADDNGGKVLMPITAFVF